GGGYGNNNPSGFAPKSAPAPTAAPVADLDDDLPF
ncbi:MAG: single-stranded DNA-binding protein, partial [Gammaproteobacteria bacterium]|nr:single-stranded DNA-binding protein [Gammaproteobacteria bacterium]